METIIELYNTAQSDGINIYDFEMNGSKSLAVMDDDLNCYIAMDYKQIKSEAEEIIRLAHELGHCVSGAFYNRYSRLDIKEKHERRAWIWAIKELISEDDLHTAVCAGNYEMWQLAEYFNLPQYFVEKAVGYYEETD